MKIGIDISQVIYGTGVSNYTENLVKALLLQDKKNEYLLFGGSLRRRADLKTFVSELKGNFESKFFPVPQMLGDILWNRLHILPIERLVGDLDVFHSSDWTQPPSKAFKVTTIHDLVPLRFPRHSHPKIVSTHKARIKWVKKEVDKIIVPSEATKKDLLKIGLKEKRIVIIPEAPNTIFKSAKKIEINKLKRKYRISGGYLLAVGVGPRKNTERIISAYEKMQAGLNLKLVFTGHFHKGTGHTLASSAYKGVEQRRGVRFIGHVETEEMPVFYSGAEALVYPSLYEGFGLPILEAFACKTPVVTSDTSSLPEISGNAAVLVDPYNVDSIAEGIRKALDQKKDLVKKGLVRIKDFSWKETARKTLEVYR